MRETIVTHPAEERLPAARATRTRTIAHSDCAHAIPSNRRRARGGCPRGCVSPNAHLPAGPPPPPAGPAAMTRARRGEGEVSAANMDIWTDCALEAARRGCGSHVGKSACMPGAQPGSRPGPELGPPVPPCRLPRPTAEPVGRKDSGARGPGSYWVIAAQSAASTSSAGLAGVAAARRRAGHVGRMTPASTTFLLILFDMGHPIARSPGTPSLATRPPPVASLVLPVSELVRLGAALRVRPRLALVRGLRSRHAA